MKVSDLAERYGIKTTELVGLLADQGMPNLGPGDPVPTERLDGLRARLSEKGYRDASGKKVTLIKKKRPDEAGPQAAAPAAPAEDTAAPAKKKIIVKRRKPGEGPETGEAAPPRADGAAPAAPRPDGPRPDGPRPDGPRPDGPRPGYGPRPDGPRPAYGPRPDGPRPAYGGGGGYGPRPDGPRPAYGGGGGYGPRPDGPRPAYGTGPGGPRPPYGGGPGGPRPAYGTGPGGPRPPYGGGPGGPRPPFGGGPGGPRPYGPRPGGGPGGPRPYGPRPGGGPGGGSGGPGGPGGPGARTHGHGRPATRRRHSTPEDREKERDIQMRRRKEAREAALESVPTTIDIMPVVSVGELARKMNLKANEIIAKLMQLGMMATINQQIDADTATLVASEFGCEVKTISLYEETVIEEAKDEEGSLKHRPPIVTVMGHVDHGKTKLLDAIRSANVVATESGGITQHIGAYQVAIEKGSVTFLDTPGHAAFTMMRARGASVTDLVVLVVAADDGIMPQTIEAIDHAKAAKSPIIVAINKVDKPEANVDRVKQQLTEHGLQPDDWGGSTMCVPVSALKKTGIKELLEAILFQAELLDLMANPDKEGVGVVLEARVDPGKGNVATVICQNGSMKIGDTFVAGIHFGKIRAMFNDKGEKVERALPSMPVEIVGAGGLPQAGDPFHVVDDDKRAKTIAAKRQELKRAEGSKNLKKVTLDTMAEHIRAGEMKQLNVILKCDVQGSAEALKESLEKIANAEVRVGVIRYSAGAITEDDVMLAAATNALLIGFHVRPNNRAKEIADKEKVEIKTYHVIYDAINEVQAALTGMMKPELTETISGQAEVREVYKISRLGTIAGCMVTEGSVHRAHSVRVIRDGLEIHDGKIQSLKRFKDDAREVAKGYECGLGIENFNDLLVGDVLETYFMKETPQAAPAGQG